MDSENDWIFSALKNIGLKVPKIKHIKSSMPKHDENSSHVDRKLFGVSLFKQEWTYESDYALPKFLAVATAYLSNFSTTVGLFRKSGSIVRQRSLRIKLKNGESLEGTDPHDVASLLKQWLRELPEPLIPHCMQDLFIRCQQLGNKSEDCINASLLCCLLLPPEHLYPLKHLLCFLRKFAMHSKENKMGQDNLALMLAPNIFTSKTGNVNMNKNCNLVQLHASVVELLIANADRIGEVPLLHHHVLEEGRSRFDSPSEITSGPSKFSRKLKAGPVQDVLSGIKKLVAHNTTAAPKKTSSPETFWSSPKLLYRPAPLNDARKTYSSPVKSEVIQVLGIKSRIDCGQKKSLGFLRIKDRKRQNSFRASSQTKSDGETSKLNSTAERMDLTLKVPASSNESETKCPKVQFEYDLQYESLPMCDTVCNLATASEEVFNLSTPLFPNFSQDGSRIIARLSQSKANLEIAWPESGKSESSQEFAENNAHKNKTAYELKNMDIKQDCTEKEAFSDLSQVKPEIFVAISKNLDKFTAHKMQRGNNNYRNNENRVDLQRSKSLVDSKWRSEGTGKNANTKTYNKTKRQHSLIRGKPNTIKNGLPYQHLNKNNLTPSFEINTEDTIYHSNDFVSFTTTPTPDASEKESREYFSEQDISLILSLANLNLSPLNNSNTPDKSCENFIITVPKKSPTPNKEYFTKCLNMEQSSPLICVSHSDSKIPRLRKVFDSNHKGRSERSPETKQQTPKLKCSRSLRRSPGNSRIPVLSKRKLHLSDLETSFNDSCFQTPNQTLYNSFSSSTCESDMYLSIYTPKDNYKKRESIARILKNNSGHVLKKIQLYDSKDAKNVTNETNNCRDSPFERTPFRSSQKEPSDKQTTASKRLSIRNRIGTPSKLPRQPSKVSINIEAYSQNANNSLKLKEVTNTNTDGKQNPSRNTTPVKDDNPLQKSTSINKQNCCKEGLRKAKLKRNSFSGHNPSKFSKRVSRSESLRSCSAV